jgi:hypothetical protein
MTSFKCRWYSTRIIYHTYIRIIFVKLDLQYGVARAPRKEERICECRLINLFRDQYILVLCPILITRLNFFH